MKSILRFSLFLTLAALALAQSECVDEGKCKAPNCRCMTDKSPLAATLAETPQFVMLSFDDAINAINYDPLYKDLFTSLKRKNPKGCNIGATFFASHEYNNYAHMHDLFRHGSEIAVHTITHVSSTEAWKKFDDARWRNETVGMRDMISKYAKIPIKNIQGFRSPFLQTGGDVTFKMLSSLPDKMYDSSMPTLSYTDPPIWPYTMDYGYPQDCVIQPCPDEKYPGQWIVPMVSYFKKRMVEGPEGEEEEEVPCSMADACLPYPETETETFDYLMQNFNRHYTSNKAPLPVFLHESWLKNEHRKKGYFKFIDEILKKPGVYVVPIQEVLAFMKNPKKLSDYQQTLCVTTPTQSQCSPKAKPTATDLNGKFCNYDTTSLGGPRILYTCNVACPKVYPWLNNVNGIRS